jgi:hypothetical protein
MQPSKNMTPTPHVEPEEEKKLVSQNFDSISRVAVVHSCSDENP